MGRLGKWLRMMGYDTVLFGNGDDSQMVARALAEDRVILTRDTAITQRRLVTSGRLKAILISSPRLERQLRQVLDGLDLDYHSRQFTICLECNQPLVTVSREQVKDRVPPYVFKTQSQYMECPACHRVYWKGTHWQAMARKLDKLAEKTE